MKLRTRRNRCWLRQAPLLTDGVAESIPETIAEESLWQYLAFVCLVASLPFGWLSLGTFMGLNVRPAHLASLFMVITHLPQMRRYHPASHPWIGFYVIAFTLYAIAMTLSIRLMPDKEQAFAAVAKIYLHFGLLLALMQIVAVSSRRKLAFAASFGGPFGVLGFVLVATSIYASAGRNLWVEYTTAVLTADLEMLQFGFYSFLFRSQGSAALVGAPLRNTLMGGFLLVFLITLYYRPLNRSYYSQRVGRTLVLVAAPFIVLTSVSRSNMLALALMVLVTQASYYKSYPRLLAKHAFVAGTFCLLALSVGSLIFSDEMRAISTLIVDRFGVVAADPRVGMYTLGIEAVGEEWLTGSGIGSTFNGERIHNLFLASLYEGGIFAFTASLLFYLTIVGLMVSLASSNRVFSQRSAYWLVAFPVLPLLRAMLSGEGGNFTLVETMCLAYFFGEWLKFYQPSRLRNTVESWSADAMTLHWDSPTTGVVGHAS